MKSLRALGRGFFVALQYLLPQFGLTRAIAWLSHRESVWLKNALIRGFSKLVGIDEREAEHPVPEGYDSLNAFFTRTLKPGCRPLDTAPAIIAPCDGVVSQFGPIVEGQLIQAKGFLYSVERLIGSEEQAQHFRDGSFATIYLAPHDYHRVHAPLSAVVSTHRHIPGQLFSVNQATAAAVPRLFARNERRVFCFGPGGADAALVMVGALNVGSISTPWHGELAAGTLQQPQLLPCPTERVTRGDQLGWFNLGSTVIVLLPKGVTLAESLQVGRKVRMGETLATPSISP
ncbi:MAG: archaetidylserine decarboxylase [Pseudomonadota bacterium]